MKKLLRAIIVCFIAVGMGTLTSIFVFTSIIRANEVPSAVELGAVDNISTALPISHKRAIRKSRESAVQILSLNPTTSVFSASSGTYVTVFGRYFILTVDMELQVPVFIQKL